MSNASRSSCVGVRGRGRELVGQAQPHPRLLRHLDRRAAEMGLPRGHLQWQCRYQESPAR